MAQHSLLDVVVWGPLACYTRPENKVERVSYPMLTPSAARGVLEAICWKPQMEWQVREIHLLLPRGDIPARRGMSNADWLVECTKQPFRWQSILRNEITGRQSHKSNVMTKGARFLADDSSNRAQRHTLALRDVRYLIRAEIVTRSGKLARLEDGRETPTVAKYAEQFKRRVASGACFSQPYLGCREFVCNFGPPEPGDERPLLADQPPVDLGRMLFDLRFRHNERGLGIGGDACFFDAQLDKGVLRVPHHLYLELRQPEAA